MTKRDVKFRGKSVASGEWLFGSYCTGEITHGVSHFITENIQHRHEDLLAYKVQPDTVGQYTGLKDKNGKEVYENDIVRWERYPIPARTNAAVRLLATVKWINCGFYVEYFDNDSPFKNEALDPERYIEVIGNIHDNKIEDYDE